jgi:acetyl esterase/lipase
VDFRFPAGVDDVLDAGVWARSTAATGLKKVGFIGSSAGGNLVVEAALATGQPAVSWSGPIDLAGFIEETDGTAAADAPTQDYSKISSADINQGGRNDGFLRWVIMENVGNDRSQLPSATPINRAVSISGPIYMASSIGEFVPPDGALAMQRALMKVGVESIVHVIPGTLRGDACPSSPTTWSVSPIPSRAGSSSSGRRMGGCAGRISARSGTEPGERSACRSCTCSHLPGFFS